MNNRYKILLVEDEANILTFVKALLEANDYQVIIAKNCTMAKTLYACYLPDLVILDLGLPDEDGSVFLQKLRKEDRRPVIVLSARTDEGEKVRLLDMGANDYITKPFGSEELLARIRTALRNYRMLTGGENGAADVFVLGELRIDHAARKVYLKQEQVKLTRTEYNILACLAHNCGRVMTYSAIIKDIWGEYPDDGTVKKLQVNMANIRKKLGARPGERSYIINELGVGYRMEE